MRHALDDVLIDALPAAAGVYAVALAAGVSGAIAVVAAGLLLGDRGFRTAMSETTQRYVRGFWTLVDEILNALLFVLVGLEVLALTFANNLLRAGLLAIPAILLARWASVGAPMTCAAFLDMRLCTICIIMHGLADPGANCVKLGPPGRRPALGD